MSGSVSSGYAVSLAVGVDTTTTPTGGQLSGDGAPPARPAACRPAAHKPCWARCGVALGKLALMTVLALLPVVDGNVLLRRATAEDVRGIVDLLAADQLGAARDGATTGDELLPYLRAFATIDADPAQLLVVAVADEQLAGTMQLTFLPGLARRGALRAQVEAVRVHPDHRARGLGSAMIGWAVAEARRRGCALVQLTSDKSRADAHRFYERLGFTASHEGFKLRL